MVTNAREEVRRQPALPPLAWSGGQSSHARQAGAVQALKSKVLGQELCGQLLPTDLLRNQRFGVRQQLELAQSRWKAGKTVSC